MKKLNQVSLPVLDLNFTCITLSLKYVKCFKRYHVCSILPLHGNLVSSLIYSIREYMRRICNYSIDIDVLIIRDFLTIVLVGEVDYLIVINIGQSWLIMSMGSTNCDKAQRKWVSFFQTKTLNSESDYSLIFLDLHFDLQ